MSVQATREEEKEIALRGGWTHILVPDPSDAKCIEDTAGLNLEETEIIRASRIGESLLGSNCFWQLATLKALYTLEPSLRPQKINILVPGDEHVLGLAGLIMEYVVRAEMGIYTTHTLVEGNPKSIGNGFYSYIGSIYEAISETSSTPGDNVIVNVDSSSPMVSVPLSITALLAGARAVYYSLPDGKVVVVPLPPSDVDVEQLELLLSSPGLAPWAFPTKHLVAGREGRPALNPWLERLLG